MPSFMASFSSALQPIIMCWLEDGTTSSSQGWQGKSKWPQVGYLEASWATAVWVYWTPGLEVCYCQYRPMYGRAWLWHTSWPGLPSTQSTHTFEYLTHGELTRCLLALFPVQQTKVNCELNDTLHLCVVSDSGFHCIKIQVHFNLCIHTQDMNTHKAFPSVWWFWQRSFGLEWWINVGSECLNKSSTQNPYISSPLILSVSWYSISHPSRWSLTQLCLSSPTLVKVTYLTNFIFIDVVPKSSRWTCQGLVVVVLFIEGW